MGISQTENQIDTAGHKDGTAGSFFRRRWSGFSDSAVGKALDSISARLLALLVAVVSIIPVVYSGFTQISKTQPIGPRAPYYWLGSVALLFLLLWFLAVYSAQKERLKITEEHAKELAVAVL